ncbi:uncharacterized protein FOMMEDRAFT_159942 [Fomitiporia mediterranea MF3/22]|uniref:uncharacterized protein n=1 Tax=Fomitiporia mediterranea (strain MF3/22) TaxID=694068 RepID=UPI00044097F4|nr:uncharacterized protein FOMMEDRAFT_159942 [Fomitiporia mediterranea MF3/22]EJD00253.1 hypothetical protein FOMMEDRAFT_159942 [Fomitiporia mediterranea MF3/22]
MVREQWFSLTIKEEQLTRRAGIDRWLTGLHEGGIDNSDDVRPSNRSEELETPNNNC